MSPRPWAGGCYFAGSPAVDVDVAGVGYGASSEIRGADAEGLLRVERCHLRDVTTTAGSGLLAVLVLARLSGSGFFHSMENFDDRAF